MGISLGLVGLGAFGTVFADLFKRHPLVSRVGLCDREPERIAKFAQREDWKDKFNPRDAYESIEAMVQADFDALVIITQPWLHAPQALLAMEHGKHVYSAVPIISLPDFDEIEEWCGRLIEGSRRTGMRYMLGETTFYRPQCMRARKLAAEGFFGRFVFAEGEYYHDWSHGLVAVRRNRLASKAGQEWQRISKEKYAGKGFINSPMSYPTHSCCGPVAVMKAHAVKATAYAFRALETDAYYREFSQAPAISNVSAFFEMSNGATCRINEFRQIGMPGREMFNIYGTEGAMMGELYHQIEPDRKTDWTNAVMTAKKMEFFSEAELRDPLPPEVYEAWKDTETNSVEYGGHGGSHAFLVHEFVDAIAHNRQPAVNIWEAARYMAMGIAAHRSALREGERVAVPDWGDAPA